MAWKTRLTAKVRRRKVVMIGDTVITQEDFAGADNGNTIVPVGTVFVVDKIRQSIGGFDGSRVYLYGEVVGHRIHVPAKSCLAVQQEIGGTS